LNLNISLSFASVIRMSECHASSVLSILGRFIVSRRMRTGFCRFAYWFTVDRHGLRPRDDNTLCHCEEQRDAAIHRVSRDAYGDAVRLSVHSGSPRAFLNALAMTGMREWVLAWTRAIKKVQTSLNYLKWRRERDSKPLIDKSG
jgi:hypothetical protein